MPPNPHTVIRLGSLGVEFSAFIRDITLGFGRLKSLLPSKVSFELISFEFFITFTKLHISFSNTCALILFAADTFIRID